MEQRLFEQLRSHAFWQWLPPEGPAYFDACFDMTAEAVPAGACRQSRGRVGYVVSGQGILSGAEEQRAGVGDLFGVVQPGPGYSRRIVPAAFTAQQDSLILWLDGDVVRSVCYAACWFHARLIREVEEYFARRQEESGKIFTNRS